VIETHDPDNRRPCGTGIELMYPDCHKMRPCSNEPAKMRCLRCLRINVHGLGVPFLGKEMISSSVRRYPSMVSVSPGFKIL